MRSVLNSLRLAFTLTLLGLTPALAQVGSITGTVKDSSSAVLPGATVKLSPGGASATSDSQGAFNVPAIVPGAYTVTVDYVGFSPSTASVTVVAGQVAHVNVVMNVATEKDDIIVIGERAHGEAEAINEEKVADNILNVLPSEVITSLPNANIADAVGRLPGVTLERDEGEGKYVQVRGTEPRLANLTIDGVEVPSPEGGVRQVKLDVLPADLVESVQINKTLQPNMNGDAIGGSVNLVTRKAGDRPNLSLYSSGGFTPIANTRTVYEFGGIAGMRFGAEKRLGVMVSGSYDYNGRGIDDIEPVPGLIGNTPDISTVAIREYLYDRKRDGFGGSADYKLTENSNLYVHGLFSDFKDYGDRYEYVFNTIESNSQNVPGPFTTERRDPDFQVASVSIGGNHTFGTSLLNWQFAVARSRMLNPIGGGESHTQFNYTLPAAGSSNCQYNASATTNPYLPVFSPECFSEAYNPANMQLNQIQDSAHGQTAQLNLEGTISYAKNYHVGSHTSTFETGFYLRNAHKFDDSFEIDYCPRSAALAASPGQFLASSFLSGFNNSKYYNGHYPYGPGISWEKVQAYLAANPNNFSSNPNDPTDPCPQALPQYASSNNFDLIERVTAGYVTDSINFSRFRLVGGVRFEGTDYNTLSLDIPTNTISAKGGGSYIDVLPSVSLRARLDSQDNSALRFVYARGLSRPDPVFLTSATGVDNSTTPPTINLGNPSLKPEHGNNFDVLYERYLHPLGAIQAGFFYKQLTTPIVALQSGPAAFPGCPAATCLENQAVNAGNAHIAGVEFSFTQHFTYLPGLLSGLGLFANYSYATSAAHNVNPNVRLDSPALLRQAPNTWNISPTYDHGRLSLRVGMAYNGPNIFAYFFTACATPGEQVNSNGTCPGGDPTPGGLHGPSGDVYLYSHFQVDAQGSVYLGKGFTTTVSGLNLNNEVFGFYNGGSPYFIQREFYKPTYTFGLRWDLHHEK
jgi:TonB-dependent receptor